ncbi:MAG: hypothetical protein ACK5KR_06455 [Breznakia sp.]
MAKKNNNRRTAAKMVMDIFHKHKAYDEKDAIEVDKFKNLKLTSAVISYTIGNLIQDGVVHKTESNTYYFDQEGWNKLEKKVLRGYSLLAIVPMVFLLVYLAMMYLL